MDTEEKLNRQIVFPRLALLNFIII